MCFSSEPGDTSIGHTSLQEHSLCCASYSCACYITQRCLEVLKPRCQPANPTVHLPSLPPTTERRLEFGGKVSGRKQRAPQSSTERKERKNTEINAATRVNFSVNRHQNFSKKHLLSTFPSFRHFIILLCLTHTHFPLQKPVFHCASFLL